MGLLLVSPWVLHAGELGRLPSAEELAANGVSTDAAKSSQQQDSESTGQKAESEASTSQSASLQLSVCLGPGLPSLSKKLIDKIKAGEYIDFSELPPAKGKGRAVPQLGDGQIVVVQAADLMQSRKVIPDFATWSQCFALYTAVLALHHPERLPDLMGYMSLIARASKKYKWPAWVVYDQHFRQEASGNPGQVWAKAEPSLYTQCFTGQELSHENWCSKCQALDHSSVECPFQQRKRPWATAFNSNNSAARGGRSDSPCQKFNRYQGDCRFGRECRFLHVCSGCRGPHPVSKCPIGKGNAAPRN